MLRRLAMLALAVALLPEPLLAGPVQRACDPEAPT
jgi:hypothetical protein